MENNADRANGQSNSDASGRWEKICSYYRQSNLLNTSLCQIAAWTGQEWFAARQADTPTTYITLTWDKLIRQPGFGRKKVQRLLELLEAGIRHFGLTPDQTKPANEGPRHEPVGWDRFPLELGNFSQRLLTLCATWDVETPRDLCMHFERHGPEALLSHTNSGKKTVAEIAFFYQAWASQDLAALRLLLPLDSSWNFGLEEAVLMGLTSLEAAVQEALSHRFIDGHTLEMVAGSLGVTRARVGQLESRFLDHVKKCLDYFSERRVLLFDEWGAHRPFQLSLECLPQWKPLVEAVIERCFEQSQEGRLKLIKDEALVQNLISQIRTEWTFYCGKLDLAVYLEAGGAANFLQGVQQEGIAQGIWEIKDGKTTPLHVSAKRAALVALRSFNPGEVPAEEWLSKLRECEMFLAYDLAKLRRSYSSWQFDSGFADRPVRFPLLRREDTIQEMRVVAETKDQDGLPRQPISSSNSVERSFDPTHQALEQKLARKIQEAQQLSSDDTLLGFLDVDHPTQQEVLGMLRTLSSRFSVIEMFLYYPATTAYGLSVAAAIGLQEEDVGPAAFYRAWEAAFGYQRTEAQRKPLANSFQSVLARFGLPVGTIYPEHDPEWHGGCYLFHAAILPQFIPPLETALATAKRKRALPDLEDEDQLRSFARYLAGGVAPGQRRLIKVLNSEVGSLLVRRMIRWHLTGEDSLFPVHVRSLLGQQSGAAQVLHSPYVQFDETTGSMLLVLPVQTESIADLNSRWVIGDLEVRAVIERRPIPLDELPAENGIIKIGLTGLTGGRENISYEVEQGFSEERPFRVFEAETGRERKFPSNADLLEVAAGKGYLVVMPAESAEEVAIDSQHQDDEVGPFRVIRLVGKISSPPLLLSTASNDWIVRPRVRVGLYFYRDDGRTFNVYSEKSGKTLTVTYGQSFGLAACLPEGEALTEIHFRTTLPAVPPHYLTLQAETSISGLQVRELDEDLRKWLSGLPPAIHRISVELTSEGATSTSEWLYWKGLDRITLSGDLLCSKMPVNLKSCSGFSQKAGLFQRRQGGGRRGCITMTSMGSDEDETWEIPDNRVLITLIDGQGRAVELNQGSSVEVLPGDTRVLQFRHGGLLPLRLKCGVEHIGFLAPDKPLISRYLSALAAVYGKTGRLTAETTIELVGQEPWEVLEWRTPQTATACTLKVENQASCTWWVHQIPTNGLDAVCLRINNLGSFLGDGEKSTQIIPLNLPTGDGEGIPSDLVPGLRAMVRGSVSDHPEEPTGGQPDGRFFDVGVNFDPATLGNAVWVVDVECLLKGSSTWQTVTCLEPHDRLADVRLLIAAGPPAEPAKLSSWERKLLLGPPEPASKEIDLVKDLAADLGRALPTARWLVNWKFPAAVWKIHHRFLKGLYEQLSDPALYPTDQQKALWWRHAVADLSAHGDRSNSAVAPCLLFSSNLQMAACSLKGCEPGHFEDATIISRAFREAAAFENRVEKNDLGYVRLAAQDELLCFDFLQFFSGWQALLQEKDVNLGRFNYRDWNEYLRKELVEQTLSVTNAPDRLLSKEHLSYSLGATLRRCESLLGVLQRDDSHWLSPSIAQLRRAAEHVNYAIQTVLGPSLGAPPEIFWRPLAENEFLVRGFGHRKAAGPEWELMERRKELLMNIMQSTCFFALLLRAQGYGWEETDFCDQLLGAYPESQVSLILGTAPELFSFYFLLFTLTLPR